MHSLLSLTYDFAGHFYPRPPPAPLPLPLPLPPPPPFSRSALTDTADTAATVLASEAVYASLRGLETSTEDVSRNLVAAMAGNSNGDQWQRRTNSAGNPNVYFYKSDPYRERHPGFIY